MLHREVVSVSDQASDSEKAIMRMETKIEYIIKGVDEIKAEVRDKHHGLTGHERTLVYRLALGTGLRYNEIYTLERKNIVTTGDAPCVAIYAKNAKNRKPDTIPLTEDLTKDLEQYFNNNLAMPHIRAFRLWQNSGAPMLKEDLKSAGIEFKTEEGVVDFHSLRHTFGTLLAKSGVMPQIVQKLMRHCDINLTLKYYTHLLHSDKAKALDKLPKMLPKKPKQAKTGTCYVPDNLGANLGENPTKIHKDSAKSIN